MTNGISQTKESFLEKKKKFLHLRVSENSKNRWEIDLNAEKVILSKNVVKALGFTQAEFETDENLFSSMVNSINWEAVHKPLQDYLEGRTQFLLNEHRLPTKNGGWKNFLIQTQTVKVNENNTPLSASGTLIEINAKEDNGKMTDKPFDGVHSGVIITSPGTDRVLIDPSAREMLRLPEEPLNQFDPETLLDLNDPLAKYALETIREKGFFSGVLILQRSDGTRFPAEFHVSTFTDEKGETSQYYVFVDLTDRDELKQELHQIKSNYRLLAEHTQDVIWVFKAGPQNFTFVSPSVTPVLGYSSDEVLQLKLENILTPESYQKIKPILADDIKFVKTGKTITSKLIEIEVIRKDGGTVPSEITTTVSFDEQGEIEVIGISRDISERKQFEKALLESQDLFRASFNRATVGISIIDPSGKYLDVNDRFCDLVGYSQEELLNMSFSDLTYAEDLEPGNKILAPLFSGKKEYAIIEKRYIHKDGHLVWVLVSVATVRDENHKIRFLVVHTQDISNLKRTEDRLRQQSRAMEASPASIVIATVDGTIEYVNPKFCQVTGYTSQEVINQNSQVILTGNTPLETYKKIKASLLAGKEWHGEFQSLKKNGELFYESASISPVTSSEGKITHFIAIKEDISDKKQYEKQLLVQRDLAQSLASSTSLDTALPTCLQIAIEVSNMDAGSIYITDPISGNLMKKAVWGQTIPIQEFRQVIPFDDPQIALIQKGKPIYSSYEKIKNKVSDFGVDETVRSLAILPIMYQNKLIGCLILVSHCNEETASASQDLLETMVSQVGMIITRIQTENMWRSSQIEWQTLFDSMQDFLFILDSNFQVLEVNQLILQRLGYKKKDLIGKDISFLYTRHPDDEIAQQVIQAISNKMDLYSTPLLTARGTTIASETKLTYGHWNDQPAIFGISRDVTQRILTESKLQAAYSDLTFNLEELKKRNNEIDAISEMSASLQACAKTDDAYKVIKRHLPLIFPELNCGIYVIQSQEGSDSNLSTRDLQIYQGKTEMLGNCYALLHNSPHLTLASKGEICCSMAVHDHQEASVCTPINIQGETLGILQLAGKENQFNQNSLTLIQSVVDRIALALANISLREKLQSQSIRDPLTGLYNRRFMEESLIREFARALRAQTTIGTIMLDIDHFKLVNDKFGHLAGDLVLKELGKILQHSFRKEDIVCRYGGEEFLVLLPGASLENTVVRANQLLQDAKNLSLNYNNQNLGLITISEGVAVFPQDGKSIDDLIHSVDRALYKAKSDGRDRVRIAGNSDQ